MLNLAKWARVEWNTCFGMFTTPPYIPLPAIMLWGEHPVKFKLTYLRDFDAKDIVKATNEQWEHIGKKN